ncbi:4-hydroxy-3-methylbut-2-enyl diphosphate reductase [Cytophagaceae bacterium ABcell3]|nr:4-hydroxy-3-methylbut-2-enyl diphosphate reductase [Cytophagaceae bacterium ABcell3]
MNVNVTIDQNSGFCFGVIYAIEMAESILDEEGKLYCLGDIVHNEQEIERLKEKGLRIIDHKDLQDLHNQKVLIRAHGEPASTYQLALKNNLELIDASCPVVLKLQNRIKSSYDSGETIYIYGKKGHAEVIGLQSQTNNTAIVFENLSELDLDSLPNNMSVFSQTTKSTDKFYAIKDELKSINPNINFNDTICRQVSNRDKDLRDFALKHDKIVFVSGTKSSNGKVLYNVCKTNNPNTYFVTSPDEIDKSVFRENDNIGICGATSTPRWLMEQIKKKILSF